MTRRDTLSASDLRATRVVLEQLLWLPTETDVEDSYYNATFEDTIGPLLTVAIERLKAHEAALETQSR